jgi:hypothetical protein
MPTGRKVLEVLQNAGVYAKAADDLAGCGKNHVAELFVGLQCGMLA